MSKSKNEVIVKDSTKSKNIKKKEVKDNSNSFGKKVKSTVSELRRVTWPTFGETLKQTGVVLAFVIMFVVILLGLNSLLGWLFNMLTAVV